MALNDQNREGLDYGDFVHRIQLQGFNDSQAAMIYLRLGLLESFLKTESSAVPESLRAKNHDRIEMETIALIDRKKKRALTKLVKWSFEPGSLTIVDLSCPFVGEDLACVMFNTVMAIFLERRHECGRIIALDEAHKVPSPRSLLLPMLTASVHDGH